MAVMGLMKVNHEGHDFTPRQLARTPTSALVMGQLFMRPRRQKALAEIIDITKQGF